MPENEEPSVLDYFKSKLKFWEHKEKIVIPEEPEPAQEMAVLVEPGSVPQPARIATAAQPSQKEAAPRRPWPWRSLLALILALAGQYAFEPPNRDATAGIVLYLVSAVFLVWAILAKEWVLASLPASEPGNETLKIRLLPFLLSIPLAVVAFLSFGGNLFTPFNVAVWAPAIFCLIWAFWIPNIRSTPWWKRLQAFITRPAWQINVTRWGLLLLAVAALVIFFRVYHLNSVPAEPFSDHAEKILDVYDVTQGETHIFFPRNTGREAFQMYLTVAVSWLFGTGLSFLSLKIDTILCGLLTLPYIYLLGKELGSKRIGLLAVLFAGIAYWPNVISRVGLRFTLYPFLAAPTFYYLIRGLRTHNRNDFILSGLFLGIGLHGYTSFRIMPLVVIAAVGIYLIHHQSKGCRQKAFAGLAIVAMMSLYVFLPLARYWQQYPDIFNLRALSRLGSTEQPLPGPWWQILVSNIWNGLRMFNWDNGQIWVHSIPYRPALDVVSGALFLIGAVLLFSRYLRQRHWLDLFLLVSIPLLQLPSTLSLAFPAENPSLNRPVGAIIPVFLIVALALDGLLSRLEARAHRRAGLALTWVVALALVGWSSAQNFDLVFNQYATEFRLGAWNTSEIGAVIKQFGQVYGSTDNAWIVPYPYWVDTRLPGIWIGEPTHDFALWPEDFTSTLDTSGPKLFILKPEDTDDLDALEGLYPQGVASTYRSAVTNAGKDFIILFVPSSQ